MGSDRCETGYLYPDADDDDADADDADDDDEHIVMMMLMMMMMLMRMMRMVMMLMMNCSPANREPELGADRRETGYFYPADAVVIATVVEASPRGTHS